LIEKTVAIPLLKTRKKLYERIFFQITKDKYLDWHQFAQFPNSTKKDKMSYLFLNLMIKKHLSLDDRIIRFEKEVNI